MTLFFGLMKSCQVAREVLARDGLAVRPDRVLAVLNVTVSGFFFTSFGCAVNSSRHEAALPSRICPPYQMLFRQRGGVGGCSLPPRVLEVRRLLVVNKHDRPRGSPIGLAVAAGPTTRRRSDRRAPARSTIERLRMYSLHPSGSCCTRDGSRLLWQERPIRPVPAVQRSPIDSRCLSSPWSKCRIIVCDVPHIEFR